MKKIISIFFVLTITGCVSIPKTPVYGPYLQTISEEEPVVEITYQSDRECEQAAKLEMQKLDANTSQQFASGKMRMVCAKQSAKDKLPNKAVIVEVVTGKKNEARFVSAAACMIVLANLKSNAHTIHCGW
jgi:hypothetical protein